MLARSWMPLVQRLGARALVHVSSAFVLSGASSAIALALVAASLGSAAFRFVARACRRRIDNAPAPSDSRAAP